VVEGDVAGLVDHQQPVAAQPFKVSGQPAGVVGVAQSGDPADGGVEEHRVTGLDGLEA
jgi:hypothetical protein